jgi:hypothetical protein
METSKISFFGLIIILLIALIIPAGCKKPAEFEVVGLNVSPPEVVAGKTVTVVADVSNIGETEGNYTAMLTVDGNELETKDVSVTADSTVTITWQVTLEDPGIHRLTMGSMSGSFKILKPAEFKVSDLKVLPSEVVPGDTFTVVADVSNVGETEGTYTAILKVDENEMETKNATIAAGGRASITWQITAEDPGTYKFTVEGMSGSCKILKPAEFIVASLVLPSEPVVAKSPVTIQVQVENVGEVEGKYDAKLQVNGEEITRTITCTKGETKQVYFPIVMDKKGIYNIVIENMVDTLEVLQMPLTNATLTEDDLPQGFGSVEPEEIGFPTDTFSDFEEYGGEAQDIFFFVNPLTFEMVFGTFVSPLSLIGQAQLNREFADPDTILKDIAAVMESGTKDSQILPEITDIGDSCVGIRLFYEEDNIVMTADCCMFVRDEILSVFFVMWFEGNEPLVSTFELAHIVDAKLVEVLSTR